MGEPTVRTQLRGARTRLGLTQADLAHAAGVTRQTIGGIESGTFSPSAAVALRLARALGCRVEDLFWLDGDQPPVAARLSEGAPATAGTRVSLTHVGDGWVAHPLAGDEAFRDEMVPCDGVAEDGDTRAISVRLLDEPENLRRTVALAGCTPVLSLWARAAERWHPGLRVSWRFANSTAALAALARGEVHAAGIHLVDEDSGECNAPFVARAVPGRDVALVNLGVWDEGLVVAPGNPKSIRGGGDLARPDVRLVNREVGAGSRLLLENVLAAAGIPQRAVDGFRVEARSHLEVAQAVRAGRADCGVTSACVAAAFGLGFVPLREVRYDLAIAREYLDYAPVRQLLATLEHRWVRSQLEVLGGYATAHTGETVAEVAA